MNASFELRLAARIARRWIGVVAALSVWSTIDAVHGADAPRRNVVLIMADDLNNDLGCYGHEIVRSPQIDRLAARGVRFDRAYCQYPVCNPSRVSMLSGRYPHHTVVVDNLTAPREYLGDAVFLPQYFRAHGYRAIKVGKIYHTGDKYEDTASWDTDIRETSESKKPPAEQIERRQGEGGLVLRVPDEETWDGFVARRAVEFLDELAEDDTPFFLAVGFRRPHTPYIATRKYFELYPPKEIPLIDEPAEHLQHIPQVALTYTPSEEPLSPRMRRETTAAYYAATSFLDAQVGVVLDAIDRHGLWDNTVVVFASDHGYHLGEHGGLKHKMTLFEESARVPLVIVAPDGATGAAAEGLVELVDLYPTLAELCGLPAPDKVDGTSVAPLVRDPSGAWSKQAAYTVVSRGGGLTATVPLDPTKLGRSVRTTRYRYTEWFDGSRELYDHASDPREYRNLIDRADAVIVGELSGLLAESAPRTAVPEGAGEAGRGLRSRTTDQP